MSLDLARLVLQALRAPSEDARQLRSEFAALLAPELKITAAPAAAPELLTLAQVAAQLGTNRGALQERFNRARKAGNLHPIDKVVVVVDGVRRYPRAAVEAFIAMVTK